MGRAAQALAILVVGVPLSAALCLGVLMGALQATAPETAELLMTSSPYFLSEWILAFFLFASALSFPLALGLFVWRDVFWWQRRGIRTSPLLWGIGMLPPVVIIVFPLYLVYRNILWPRELRAKQMENVSPDLNGRGSTLLR